MPGSTFYIHLSDVVHLKVCTILLTLLFTFESIMQVLPPRLSPLVRFMRDYAYDVLSANRYRLLGKREQCCTSDPTHTDRFLE